MTKKKILMVCEAFGGGVFTYVSQLCNDMVDDFDIYLAYSLRPQTPENYKDFLNQKVHLIKMKHVGIKGLANLKSVIEAIKELRLIEKNVQPDVIHLHSSVAGALGRLAYKGKNNIVIYTPHGYAHILMGPGKKSKIYRLVEKFLGNRALTLTCCKSEDEEAKKFSKRREICEKTMALLQFRKQYPKSACRVLGIDAAAQEIGCRPEVFAQGFRTLKNDTCFGNTDKGYIKLPQLHVTYHVGEDFLDVIDGLRAINEAVLFLNMDCGDRLGHALALGIEPEDWYKDKGFCISLPQQDYLDNVVWMYHAIVRYHIDGLDNLKDFLEAEYYKYFNAIYGRFMDMDYIKNIQKTRGKNGHKGNMLFDIHAYYDSWKLRGDIPQLYRNGYYLFDKTDISPLASYSVNWNFPRDIEVREKSEAAVLYYYYHYNGLVRIEGKKIIEKKVSADYIRGVKFIQKAMQWEISEKGIAIETNPSSNYMIGTFSKYDQHPITTFYNNGLTSERELLKSSSQIWVSINTDDQGIFNIKLENEYAFIARALEKKVDENGEKMYSKSMIYDWLDKIRKMGLNQSFLTVNDDANDKLPENARTEQYTV